MKIERSTGKALRNAAFALSSFFGRFGDTKPRKQYAPQEIGGTHKFKKGDERFDDPVEHENIPYEFWELPAVYTFREWHNYWRQYLRRVFVVPPGRVESTRPHYGKKATRAIKRMKVRAMKAAGHFKGDNRPAFG